MNIAALQLTCVQGDTEANLSILRKWIARAAAAGCSLVVFPEFFNTGYRKNSVRSLSEKADEQTVEELISCARANSISVCGGIARREAGAFSNTLIYISADGTIEGEYRKTHLCPFPPFDEDDLFQAGDDFVVVEDDGVHIGLSTCYDLRFPEMFGALRRRGAEVLINVSSWPEVRISQWETLCKARAIENQAYLIACNQVGGDDAVTCGGMSMIIHPDGRVIAGADRREEKLLTAELDLAGQAKFRSAMPVLKSRRDDLY